MTRHRMTVEGPVPFTEEEEAEWDAQQLAWEANEVVRKAEQLRIERNRLLSETDWTQGKDIPDEVSNTWVAYRQELRDITTQSGFPNEIIWPTKPI